MRRSLAIGALAASIVGLAASPAYAHGEDPSEGGQQGDADGFMPVDPSYYEQSPQFEACGSTITMTSGDVREAEERVTELATGETLIEFRGAFTVDLVRESDGAMIDELDIGGPGWEVDAQIGDEVLITQVLYGASILFPAGGPVDEAAFEEAGIPALAYFQDPEDRVQVEIRIDAETGEPIDVEFTNVDAELVDLCAWFDEGKGDGGDKDHHDGDEHGHHGDAKHIDDDNGDGE